MGRKNNVSETELEVLKLLWKYGGSIRQPDFLDYAKQQGKDWKRQTLNTFLSRLEEKGLVHRENSVVTPVYSEEDYNALQMKEAVNVLYGGKISRMIAAIIDRNGLSSEDADELQELLKQKDKN